MIRIAHILDESANWSNRLAVEQLIDRLPRDRFDQRLAAMEPTAVVSFGPLRRQIYLAPRRLGLDVLAAPRLRSFLKKAPEIDLIHAWGAGAAVAARSASSKPLIVTLDDPVAAKRDVKVFRSLSESPPFAVVVTCQIVRRRLIEGGLTPEHIVVIRPGVDFAHINRVQRSDLRRRLGVPPETRLVYLPPPVTRDGGHGDAALAVNILNRIAEPHRAAISGHSRELARIVRFHERLPTGNVLMRIPSKVPVEDVTAVSDAVVLAARSDVPTTVLAWAMASRTAIVAAAGYAVAELVANNVNGLLFKQTPGRAMTAAIARRLRDRRAIEKNVEVARGQAYEVFGLRRFVEDYTRVYDNLLQRRSPGEGVEDVAVMA